MSAIQQAIQVEKIKGATIRFEIRNEKKDKFGKVPIRLIYQVKGQRKYINAGISLLPECWDAKNQQAIFVDRKDAKKSFPKVNYELFLTQAEVRDVNNVLLDFIAQTKRVTDRFKLDGVAFSSEMVVAKVKDLTKTNTLSSEPTNFLFDFIDQYIEENKSTREPGSLTVYKSMKRHLEAYQKETKRKVTFDKIDHNFFLSFQKFLINRTKVVDSKEVPLLNNTTIAKQLSTLKTFLGYAKMQNLNVSDDYKKFKIYKDSLEVIALTLEEFESLYKLDLTNNKRLDQVRDLFCFACTTGFRYSDMNQLKREHIKNGEIKLRVIKTNELLTVPLNAYSSAILNKYKEHRKPLPMISNQKLNEYLKELCKLAGINEPTEIVRSYGVKRQATTYPKYQLIGVHTGRKTFVCLSLEKGMSAEQVMACTGHKTYHSFKRYLNVTEKLKKVVMLKAWGGELKESKLKAV